MCAAVLTNLGFCLLVNGRRRLRWCARGCGRHEERRKSIDVGFTQVVTWWRWWRSGLLLDSGY